jgi:hypothetical protein
MQQSPIVTCLRPFQLLFVFLPIPDQDQGFLAATALSILPSTCPATSASCCGLHHILRAELLLQQIFFFFSLQQQFFLLPRMIVATTALLVLQ